MEKSIVINKDSAERWIAGELGTAEFINILRAAPETVSLEGVERWDKLDFGGSSEMMEDEFGQYVLYDDLRRLVSPVQPSTVDDMAMMIRRLVHRLTQVSEKKELLAVQALDYLDRMGLKADILRSELSQPVAPVQSGGVDTFTLDAMKNAWATRFGAYQYEFNVFFDILFEMHKKSITHLTTTQSAPSVPSEDELMEMWKKINYQWKTLGTSEKVGGPTRFLIPKLHTLLTERQGAKPEKTADDYGPELGGDN